MACGSPGRAGCGIEAGPSRRRLQCRCAAQRDEPPPRRRDRLARNWQNLAASPSPRLRLPETVLTALASISRPPAAWRLALPGFAAFLIGIGLGRFAYTPLLPVMIEAGWLSVPEAALVGAGNLIGSLVAAWSAGALGARLGLVRTLRISLVVCLVATAACALPAGFAWIAAWRVVNGFAGMMLATLAAPLIVGAAPPAQRGAVSGLVFTGVGLGMALTGLLLPPLAQHGPAAAWLGTLAVTAVALVVAWRGWPPVTPARAAGPTAPHLLRSGAFLLLLAGYMTDAVGFVPHGIFWVDFVARDLGRGVEAGGLQWTLFGIGAALGPMACGRLADALGFGRALLAGFAIKATAVLLPLAATDPIALAASSLVVGGLTPGIAALVSGAALEMFGPAAHGPAWRWLMIAFGLASTAAGYAFSVVLAATHSYPALFAIGGGVMGCGGLLCALAVARTRAAR